MRLGLSRLLIALTLMALPSAGVADAPLIILDRTQLPFDLGPGHPANSPSRTENSPNAAANSSSNPGNASSTWQNRPSNPANEQRLIITADGNVLGYYATSSGGVLNLFDVNGRRVAFRPARGTRSLFTTRGEWCGTVDGGSSFVLAVTQSCASQFGR